MHKTTQSVVDKHTTDVIELLRYEVAQCSAKIAARVPLTCCLACGNEGCPGFVSAEIIVMDNGGDLKETIHICQIMATI